MVLKIYKNSKSIEMNSIYIVPTVSIVKKWEEKQKLCQKIQFLFILNIAVTIYNNHKIILFKVVFNLKNENFTSDLKYLVVHWYKLLKTWLFKKENLYDCFSQTRTFVFKDIEI